MRKPHQSLVLELARSFVVQRALLFLVRLWGTRQVALAQFCAQTKCSTLTAIIKVNINFKSWYTLASYRTHAGRACTLVLSVFLYFESRRAQAVTTYESCALFIALYVTDGVDSAAS